MRYGIAGPITDPRQVSAWAATAEAAGFDLVGLGDSPALWPDVWVALTAAAQATSRIRIGPTVTNLVTRHVGVTAAAAASVDALSDGRLVVGVGVGDSGVLNLGARPQRLTEFERDLVALRSLMRGTSVTLGDVTVRNTWAAATAPVLVAAAGPRTLELAGRSADGAIVSAGLGADQIRHAQSLLERGRAQRVTDHDLEVWYQVRVAVRADRASAVREVRSNAAAVGHHALSADPGRHGVPPELHPAFAQLRARYQPAYHCVPGDSPNAVLIDELGLTDYLVDRFVIAGSPADCAEQVLRLRDLGAENLLLAAVADPWGTVERWGADVRPLVEQA